MILRTHDIQYKYIYYTFRLFRYFTKAHIIHYVPHHLPYTDSANQLNRNYYNRYLLELWFVHNGIPFETQIEM